MVRKCKSACTPHTEHVHTAPENWYKGPTNSGTPVEGGHLLVCNWGVPQDNKLEFNCPITLGEDQPVP